MTFIRASLAIVIGLTSFAALAQQDRKILFQLQQDRTKKEIISKLPGKTSLPSKLIGHVVPLRDAPDLSEERKSLIENSVKRFNQGNRFYNSMIINFNDGSRYVIRQEGGTSTAKSTGRPVGSLPPATPTVERSPLQISRIVRYNTTQFSIQNTGQATGPLEDENPLNPFRMPIIGESFCGADTAEPASHCALFTGRLRHDEDGTFCTGVVISSHHVLTAAHCLCDKLVSGKLDPAVYVTLGSGKYIRSLSFADAPPAFFDKIEGGVCVTGVPWSERRGNGDLAVLTLADPDPEDTFSPIETVQRHFVTNGADTIQSARLSALLGVGSSEVWSNEGLRDNLFATWGYGEGPDRAVGVKRGLNYPLAGLLPCRSGDTEICDGLQEALFADPNSGLCAGDSGSGLFKPVDNPVIPEGYGAWALMGITSGYANPADCFDPLGALLATQWPRNVVRIDTELVSAWLDEVTEGAVMRAEVRMTYDTELAGTP